MNYADRKRAYQRILTELESEFVPLLDSTELGALARQLTLDMEADFFTVVVVGEFKRGKSTFVNALLGEALLPMDVTPTTATINALIGGAERRLSVHNFDGPVEHDELTADVLRKYTADSGIRESDIRYLKLMLPSPLLDNRVVLVDTPGVDDINRQRAEITYQFVPRADAVLFLLDLTSPVKRSEQEFLQESLLREGLERIVFVANFKDLIDEEEEDIADIVRFAEQRLAKITGNPDAKVLPISAAQALQGKLDNDAELLRQSGLPEAEERIRQLIANGTQGEMKAERFRMRILALLRDTLSQIRHEERLIEATDEELAARMNELNRLVDRKMSRRDKLERYVADRQTEILLIIGKSLRYFSGVLKEDVHDAIETYKGTDFKEYVERQLPVTVKRSLKRWIEQYSESIHSLLRQLELRLAEALAKEFNAVIRMDAGYGRGMEGTQDSLRLEAKDVSHSNLMAGLVVGGIGTLAIVLTGGLLLPLLGMAGYPFVQRAFAEQKLKEAKQLLRGEVDPAIDQVVDSFEREIRAYVTDCVKQIRESSVAKFEEQLGIYKRRTELEIESRRSERMAVRNKRKALAEAAWKAEQRIRGLEEEASAGTNTAIAIEGGAG